MNVGSKRGVDDEDEEDDYDSDDGGDNDVWSQETTGERGGEESFKDPTGEPGSEYRQHRPVDTKTTRRMVAPADGNKKSASQSAIQLYRELASNLAIESGTVVC